MRWHNSIGVYETPSLDLITPIMQGAHLRQMREDLATAPLRKELTQQRIALEKEEMANAPLVRKRLAEMAAAAEATRKDQNMVRLTNMIHAGVDPRLLVNDSLSPTERSYLEAVSSNLGTIKGLTAKIQGLASDRSMPYNERLKGLEDIRLQMFDLLTQHRLGANEYATFDHWLNNIPAYQAEPDIRSMKHKTAVHPIRGSAGELGTFDPVTGQYQVVRPPKWRPPAPSGGGRATGSRSTSSGVKEKAMTPMESSLRDLKAKLGVR